MTAQPEASPGVAGTGLQTAAAAGAGKGAGAGRAPGAGGGGWDGAPWARSQWPLSHLEARWGRTVLRQTGFVAARECVSVGVCVWVCARARARLCRVWVGVRACEPACRRRGWLGLPNQPVDRVPGGKLPQPPGPPALLSPGQVSASRGPPK